MPKVIIIGAGIAGLASAIRLAVKGFEVEIFEANGYPGGKLSEITCNNSRFDAGPSLFTMPQYVDELFILSGREPRKYFNYQKLENVCHYFFDDGTQINAYADEEKFANEIALKTKDSSASVLDFFRKSAEIYDITNHIFLQKSLHKVKSYLSFKTLWSVLRIAKIDSFRTMARANQDFFKDDKTRKLFNRYATYNGSNPYDAPATLNVIPHLEQHFGAYFPVGGMNAITKALVKLAVELNVKIHYNALVQEIVIKEGNVEGVRCKHEFHASDNVVSNMDIWFTYKKLLKDVKAPKKLNQERSSSALIFYWEVKRGFPRLDLHNIFFSENYKEEFDLIWKEKSISPDPTVYINISSKYKKDDAPKGCENWFVMINVPSNSGQDWAKLINEARENILKKLSKNLGTDIKPLISCEKILNPEIIEKQTSSYQGSLYGTSSNNKFAAFLRHANFSSKIGGLYFAGGSVHPGGGIPLALLSAKIVSGLVKK